MNLLLFNLATDANHVTLGFGLRWVSELARRFDHVDVVTMYEGSHALPENVTVWSVGREKGYSEIRRVWEFYRIVLGILRRRRIDVVFTHMIHVFAVLFWPVAKIFRLRNVLWYAHGSVPFGLRLAHAAVDRVVSSTPQGFRLRSAKATFVGQGVDTTLFQPVTRKEQDPNFFRIVSVGRLSPVKQIEILLDALGDWRVPGGKHWRLDLVGAGTTDAERGYEASLRARAESLGLTDRVHFHGRLDQPKIVGVLQEADVFVNLSRTGSLDKAIVEAMACGCPVISSNDAFCAIAGQEGLDWCCIKPVAREAQNSLARLSACTADQVAELRQHMRAISTKHSLDNLIGRLHEVLRGEAPQQFQLG